MKHPKFITIEYIHPEPGYTVGIGESKKGDTYKVDAITAEGLVREGRSQFWKIVEKRSTKEDKESEEDSNGE